MPTQVHDRVPNLYCYRNIAPSLSSTFTSDFAWDGGCSYVEEPFLHQRRPFVGPVSWNYVEDHSSDIDVSLQVKAIGGFSEIYEGLCACKIGPDDRDVVNVHVNGILLHHVIIIYRARRDVQAGIKLLLAFNSHGHVDLERARKRLNREVNVWKRLYHPNIAQFYGVSFQLAGRPGLVMQWYKNGTASQYISKHQDIDRLTLVAGVAKGLQYLHTLNPPIVHGDLKACNVLNTDSGHAVLTDFGLSKVVEALPRTTGNTTSSICGSVRWQAPEFFAFSIDKLDAVSPAPTLKSDLWSFACTAYELLTGNIPYHHAPHDLSVFQLIAQGMTPVTSADLALHEEPDVVALLNDCWRRSAVERPCIEEVVSRLGELSMDA